MGEGTTTTPGGSPKKKWNKKNKPTESGNKTTTKLVGGNVLMMNHYFDCTGYGQSDRFIETIGRMAIMVGQEYPYSGITKTEVETQEVILIKEPEEPKNTTTIGVTGIEITVLPTQIAIQRYFNRVKEYDAMVRHQTNNHHKVYCLAWQQCTKQLRQVLEAQKKFESVNRNSEGIELLKMIKLACFKIEEQTFIPQKVVEAKTAFYRLKQGNDSLQDYHTRYLNQVKVIEQCGSSLSEDPLIRSFVCKKLKILPDTTDDDKLETISKATLGYELATKFLLGTDPRKYNGMLVFLKNTHQAGDDKWPTTLADAYSRVSKWETDDNGKNNNNDRNSNHHEETTFATDGDEIRKKEPWQLEMTCHKCQKKGHISYFCPTKKKNATTNVQTGTVDETEETTQNLMHGVDEYNAEDDDDFDYEEHLFLQLETHDVLHLKDGINGGRIPKSWILLDSQSTTDVYSNPHLLTNIRKAKGTLTIHTQAGKAITTMKGTVKGYGDVWYHAKGIANILSLANVAKTRKVVFNSSNGNQFEVTKNDGTSQIFKKSEHGLYFYDMKKKDQIPN